MKIRPLYDRVILKRIEEEETTKGGIIIDGTGPGTPLWRIANSNVYATHPPEGRPRLQRGQESPLNLKPAEGWENMPESHSDPLEATIPLKGQVVYRWSEMGWQVQESGKTETASRDNKKLSQIKPS